MPKRYFTASAETPFSLNASGELKAVKRLSRGKKEFLSHPHCLVIGIPQLALGYYIHKAY
jgi:hypothetical protein